MSTKTTTLVLFSLLLGAGCNITTTGDHGVVDFMPDDCGLAFCSLGMDLAAGSSVEVTLDAAPHAHGLALVSDDPSVAIIFPLPFERFQVTGLRQGFARLVVIDHGVEIDTTTISVEQPARLGLIVDDGPAYTRAPEGPDEEIWVVTTGDTLAFRVRPFDAWGGELMGKMNLETEIDAALYHRLSPTANLPEGELEFAPMAHGDYWLSVYSAGVPLDVFFEAR